MPLFEEFNFYRDGKIHESELKEKYPPSGYEMTPKQAQPSLELPVLWAFVKEEGRKERVGI